MLNQKITEKNEDYFIISAQISYDDETVGLVKYWMPYIKILEPLHVKEKLDNVLKVYLAIK